jgi:hypothetical protein
MVKHLPDVFICLMPETKAIWHDIATGIHLFTILEPCGKSDLIDNALCASKHAKPLAHSRGSGPMAVVNEW